MKFKIPETFECGGSTVTVETDSSIIAREDAAGLCIHSQQLIKLAGPEMYGPDALGVTFCHEWFEFVNIELDLQLPHPMIQQLGSALWQMLKTAR